MKVTANHFFFRYSLILAACWLATPQLVGQASGQATVMPGRGEVYGLAGGYFGEGLNAPAAGGGGAYTTGRRVRVFGEVFYLRKTLEEFRIQVKASSIAFHGGVHILFPVGESRAVPFASAGFGGFRSSASAGRISVRDSGGQFSMGGGLDYYISSKWGIRPQLSVYNLEEYRASFGLFYRF